MELAELAGMVTLIGGGIAGAVVAVVAGVRKLKPNNKPQPQTVVVPANQPLADPAGETGPHLAVTDTQREMLHPMRQVEMLQSIDQRLSLIADKSNGHGYVRREEFARLERKVDKVDSKLDRVSEQVAAQAATCAARSECKPS